MEESKCAKCDGGLRKGYMPDYGYGMVYSIKWHEGEPEKSWLTGTKKPASTGKEVVAYRCIKCGLLEFYAE